VKKNYQSYRQVTAEPMTYGEYNTYCSVEDWLFDGDTKKNKGYLVEHLDGCGLVEHPAHKFRITWWPKKAFDDTYLEVKEKP
jgi:hypothetical protein